MPEHDRNRVLFSEYGVDRKDVFGKKFFFATLATDGMKI